MRACNVEVVASWKLESSRTFHWSSREVSTIAVGGTPILPPTWAATPAVSSKCPKRAVVVVLPFDPVIATTGPRKNRAANSTSPITGMPFDRAN